VSEFELVIDAGHGGKDPGAVKGNRHEEDYTLKISLYQYKRFKELGVNVALTRDTDKDLAQATRTGIAKKGKFCISNHLNAGGGDRAEVIHSIYDNGRLANLIKDELVKAGQTSVKVYFKKGNSGDYYYMHRETGATVTNIVEYCFLDNEADFAHFNANWEAYAEATVKAFCQYIGNKYSVPVIVKPVAPKPEVKGDSMYQVVTGSFKDRENADKRVNELKSKGFESFVQIK
jgi:N-acetylmuramoyl-L-alanine amidase